MKTINIHAAKTHLSRLVDQAAADHPFVIAKAGKPLVQVTAIPAPQPADRLGFMAGQFTVPDDCDSLGRDLIQALLRGQPRSTPPSSSAGHGDRSSGVLKWA